MHKYSTLVLPAGSFLGFHILGSLDFLFNQQIIQIAHLHTIIGTSVGSIIAALISIGFTPVEIMTKLCLDTSIIDNFKQTNFFNLFNNDGVVDNKPLFNILSEWILDKLGFIPTFKYIYEHFNINLIITTYSLKHSNAVIITHNSHPDLNIIDAISLSCAIPIIFQRKVFHDDLYVDGGIHNTCPMDIAFDHINHGENILCIFLFNQKYTKPFSTNVFREWSTFDVFSNCIHTLLDAKPYYLINNIYHNHPNITIIKLPFDSTDGLQSIVTNNTLSTNRKLELYSQGYNNTLNYFKKNN